MKVTLLLCVIIMAQALLFKNKIDEKVRNFISEGRSDYELDLMKKALRKLNGKMTRSLQENRRTRAHEVKETLETHDFGPREHLHDDFTKINKMLKEYLHQFDTIVHEIGHALGVHHTQTRIDRDNFVTINPENIESDSAYNFNKMIKEENDNMDVTYDYGSVMHYSAYAFAVDGNAPTIVAKDWRYQKSMGSDGIPFSDITIMNKLYKCQEKRCPMASTQCYNDGLIDSKNCSKCICPSMWSGTTCQVRNPGRGSNIDNGTCGADILVSSRWESISGAVGYRSRTTMTKSSDCYWIFKAPPGKKVQLRAQITGSLCSSECYWQGVQIYTEGFKKGGMTFCCPSEVKNQLFTFSNNLAAIRVFSKFHVAHMAFDYRYI
uniref:Metalloendopeptidase n=1 Tax=Heterorhabditis bacteriophora TaxID=37862 RepID=A0A1I7X0L7_HETBA